MRGNRIISAAGALCLLASLGGAAWAARHEASVGDPGGLVRAQAWAEVSGDGTRTGQRVDAAPPAADSGGGELPDTPLTPALDAARDLPGTWYIPSVEPPSTAPGLHLPDLVPLPAFGVYIATTHVEPVAGDAVLAGVTGETPGPPVKALRFGTTIANRGRHSLEVIGVPRPAEEGEVQVDARQCVRFAGPRVADAERTCMEYQPVGTLGFHAQHGHFHIDGFAQYRLLRDAGGRPLDTPGGVVSRSEKVGFCMGDTDWMGEKFQVVDTGWYRECRHTAPHVPVTFRQGVSPLWADTYGGDLPGQHLVIQGVPDGEYWIAITVNPPDVPGAVSLFETNRANNTSYRKVRLSQGGTVIKAF